MLAMSLALVLLPLVVPAAAARDLTWPSPLQPATYRSASGAWELSVDPTKRFGQGPGDCVLRRDGAVVWEQRLPITFFEVVVADDGRVAGYAYTQGYEDEGARGSFVVALVAPDGVVTRQHVTRRTTSKVADQPPDPKASGLFLDAAHGRFVVRLRRLDFEGDREEWHAYDLASGEEIAVHRPSELAGRPSREVARTWGVTPVPDTDLVAVHEWVPRWDLDPTRNDARVSLVDLEGRTVWSELLVGDLDHGDEIRDWLDLVERVRTHGGILDVTPGGRFAVWSLKARERIDLRASRGSEPGTWDVEELARTPFDPAQAEPEGPFVVPLALRRVVALDLFANEAPEPPGPCAGFVDQLGRIVAVDENTPTVRVFDLDGHPLLVTTAEPGGFRGRFALPNIAVAHDGSLFLGDGVTRGHLGISPQGDRTGRTDLGAPKAAFVPGEAGRWVNVHQTRLDLLTPTGEVASRVERHPTGDWFRWIDDHAVAHDGSVVVLDDRPFYNADRPRLSWYAADARPLGAVELPAGSHAERVAATPEWIAVGSWTSELLLVRRDDGALYRFEAEVADAEASAWDFGFPPGGRELWLIRRQPLTLHRFALP